MLIVKIYSNELSVPGEANKIAKANNFVVKAYKFDAQKEDLRKPRIVRIGAVQNSAAAPTNAPISEQRDAMFSKIANIVEAAGAASVNVLCLQEAWSEFTERE